MKWNKKTKSNTIFYGGTLLVLLFLFVTPWGQSFRAWMMSFTLSSPDIENHQIVSEKEAFIEYDWSFQSDDDQQIFLSSIDKPIFLNVWATWCGPCRTEMSSIMALQKEYGDRVEFILVSSEKMEVLKKYKAAKNIEFPVYTMLTAPPANLSTGSFPTTYIISKDKDILMKVKGAHDWNSQSVHDYLDKILVK
ncbi:MAG: thiol-disulfide isomerase/thioredoxin [Flavobacteriales bacterium]|jgi:thiol-disulfide isomerase/thioredoxin